MKTTLYTIESEVMIDQIGLPVSNTKSGSGSGPDEGSGSGTGSDGTVETQKYAKVKDTIWGLPSGYGKITFECFLSVTAEFPAQSDPRITGAELKVLVDSSHETVHNNETTIEYYAYPTEAGHRSIPLGNYTGTFYKDANFEYTLKKVVKKDGEETPEESTHNVSVQCNYSIEFQGKKLIVKITSASGSFS